MAHPPFFGASLVRHSLRSASPPRTVRAGINRTGRAFLEHQATLFPGGRQDDVPGHVVVGTTGSPSPGTKAKVPGDGGPPPRRLVNIVSYLHRYL